MYTESRLKRGRKASEQCEEGGMSSESAVEAREKVVGTEGMAGIESCGASTGLLEYDSIDFVERFSRFFLKIGASYAV